MKCPHCPNYKQKTSYGTEMLKCNNKECEVRRRNDKVRKGSNGVHSRRGVEK